MSMQRFAALLIVAFLSTTANADTQTKTSNYTTAFHKVVDSCHDNGLSLNTSTVTIATHAKQMRIHLPNAVELHGKVLSHGRLRAAAKEVRESGETIQYALNGRVRGDSLRAVFLIEYFRDSHPVCTQSWSMVTTKQPSS